MFRYASRRVPFRIIGLIAAGFILANLLTSVGGAVLGGLAFLAFLPLLMLKFFMLMMFFRFMLGFAHRGFASPEFAHHTGGPWTRTGPRSREPKAEKEPSKEESEWREAVRRAREELDELFPD